jgi:hypothetical protein
MTVRTVVISQGVGYCKHQGVAFVNLFLSPMEGGRHFKLGVQSQSQVVKFLDLLKKVGALAVGGEGDTIWKGGGNVG